MPHSRPKPSEIAAEAKKHYIPWLNAHFDQYPARSFFISDGATFAVSPSKRNHWNLSIAVVDGDPVDAALVLYQHNAAQEALKGKQASLIPVINTANERRPGGDWESGIMAPEECLARRSNLVKALVTAWSGHGAESKHYPIPPRGGLYSPSIMVFRNGPDQYTPWSHPQMLPVISVAPVRRPRLDETGTQYSFEQEKDLMLEKMRTVLRIAAHYGHKDICLGTFGAGATFRNPVEELARMWKQLLFNDEEFDGVFDNIVFAIDNEDAVKERKGGLSDLAVFEKELAPERTHPTSYR
ncbi:hypothetical protein P152DRAFT_25736 [Eremomyces bilateralis CBS 781.70]|uniref:Microbial-type PARG catalytic domain-containing protein n=1 Tax=Eremomyces bilateralis CBS 781.70 TaxID=1392243 RepID=A0A6G1GI48_9PEZI|nr:uncharacterized protein P152DRAFT_25736 [Eremomyces bilateralis CBS 781.70]KAF1817652.1 hypothetical protein P152DRAFT_25736 [Eremomyces bilateralis CBS 781.70]